MNRAMFLLTLLISLRASAFAQFDPVVRSGPAKSLAYTIPRDGYGNPLQVMVIYNQSDNQFYYAQLGPGDTVEVTKQFTATIPRDGKGTPVAVMVKFNPANGKFYQWSGTATDTAKSLTHTQVHGIVQPSIDSLRTADAALLDSTRRHWAEILLHRRSIDTLKTSDLAQLDSIVRHWTEILKHRRSIDSLRSRMSTVEIVNGNQAQSLADLYNTQYTLVFNGSISTILRGHAVEVISASSEGYLLVQQATSGTDGIVVGIAVDEMPPNSSGRIAVYGIVDGIIDMNSIWASAAFASGDTAWVSAFGAEKVQPPLGEYSKRIGFVMKNDGDVNTTFFVNPSIPVPSDGSIHSPRPMASSDTALGTAASKYTAMELARMYASTGTHPLKYDTLFFSTHQRGGGNLNAYKTTLNGVPALTYGIADTSLTVGAGFESPWWIVNWGDQAVQWEPVTGQMFFVSPKASAAMMTSANLILAIYDSVANTFTQIKSESVAFTDSPTDINQGFTIPAGTFFNLQKQRLAWKLSNLEGWGAITIHVGNTSNRTRLLLGGRVKPDSVWWDDIRIGGAQSRNGASAPNFIAMKNGIYADHFSNTVVQEKHSEIQLPHGWVEGTDLYPHVHWTPSTTDTGKVIWGLEYVWTNIGDTLTASTTISTTVVYAPVSTPIGTRFGHYISSFPAISGTGKRISSMLMFRIFRAATDPTDSFSSGKVYLLETDFHAQFNQMGSELEYKRR